MPVLAPCRKVAEPYFVTTQTRELLVKKQEKLVALLKALAARVPRRAMASVSTKFAEIDRALKVSGGVVSCRHSTS